MSETVQTSPGEAAVEPSLAELFDPAALEARLTEARARRAEAIARRAAAGSAGEPSRPARVRTLDMAAQPTAGTDAAAAARSGGFPPRNLTLIAPASGQARAPVAAPTAQAPPWPPADALPQPAAGAASTRMAERLAAAVSRKAPVAPAAADVVAPRPWYRQPVAVLGLGLLAGAVIAAAALVVTRPAPLDGLAPPTPTASVAARPELRFDTPLADNLGTTGLPDGFTLPGPGAPPLPVVDNAPAVPEEATLPGAVLSAALGSPSEGTAPLPLAPAFDLQEARAPLAPVAALPALATANGFMPQPPAEATLNGRWPALPAQPPSGSVLPAAPLLPALSPPPALPPVAASTLAGRERASRATLRYAAVPPEGTVRAALSLPGNLPDDPSIGYGLPVPPPAAEPAAPTQRAARPPAPAAPRTARQEPATAPRRAAAPPPANSGANRARLERAVEDMLRDRLLRN